MDSRTSTLQSFEQYNIRCKRGRHTAGSPPFSYVCRDLIRSGGEPLTFFFIYIYSFTTAVIVSVKQLTSLCITPSPLLSRNDYFDFWLCNVFTTFECFRYLNGSLFSLSRNATQFSGLIFTMTIIYTGNFSLFCCCCLFASLFFLPNVFTLSCFCKYSCRHSILFVNIAVDVLHISHYNTLLYR